MSACCHNKIQSLLKSRILGPTSKNGSFIFQFGGEGLRFSTEIFKFSIEFFRVCLICSNLFENSSSNSNLFEYIMNYWRTTQQSRASVMNWEMIPNQDGVTRLNA